jgi:hypothetical protein
LGLLASWVLDVSSGAAVALSLSAFGVLGPGFRSSVMLDSTRHP